MGEAEKPFKSMSLQPLRRLRHDPGMEIECRTHRKQRHRKQLAILKDPRFLTRASQAYKNDRRAACLDSFGDVSLFLSRYLPESRWLAAGNFQIGKLSLDVDLKIFQDLFTAPIE